MLLTTPKRASARQLGLREAPFTEAGPRPFVAAGVHCMLLCRHDRRGAILVDSKIRLVSTVLLLHRAPVAQAARPHPHRWCRWCRSSRRYRQACFAHPLWASRRPPGARVPPRAATRGHRRTEERLNTCPPFAQATVVGTAPLRGLRRCDPSHRARGRAEGRRHCAERRRHRNLRHSGPESAKSRRGAAV